MTLLRIAKWPMVEEPADPLYIDATLTMRPPPVLLQDFSEYVIHSEVPRYVVDDGPEPDYTRARFTIHDTRGVKNLFLAADYDDAYVAWLNGVEVYRSPEMPAGTPNWDADPALHESSNGQVPDYGTPIDISSDGNHHIALRHVGSRR